MAIGSLFSGIGGLDLALEWAGFEGPAWQVEIDPWCRRVLAKHWPRALRLDDVRTLDGASLPYASVWCGGFPCQDISIANPNGKGLDGERSGLWFDFRRLLDESRAGGGQPVGILVENVGRLARRGVDRVADGLVGLGYHVEISRILASHVGAPHRRERCFIVGRLADANRPRELQPQGAVAHQRRRAGDSRAPGVGDANGAGLEGRGLPECGRADEWPAWAAGGPGARGRTGSPQPRLGRVLDGLPHWVDGAGPGGAWPAARGAVQHEWEPPRTCVGRMNRSARIAGLGNAVSPQAAMIAALRLRELLENA